MNARSLICPRRVFGGEKERKVGHGREALLQRNIETGDDAPRWSAIGAGGAPDWCVMGQWVSYILLQLRGKLSGRPSVEWLWKRHGVATEINGGSS